MVIILCVWFGLAGLRDYASILLQFILKDNRVRIKQLNRIWHGADAGIRVMLSAWMFYRDYWPIHGYDTIRLWLIFLAAWWILFDPYINKMRNKEVFYVGITATMDRLTRKLSKVVKVNEQILQLTMKTFLIVTLIAWKSILEIISGH